MPDVVAQPGSIAHRHPTLLRLGFAGCGPEMVGKPPAAAGDLYPEALWPPKESLD